MPDSKSLITSFDRALLDLQAAAYQEGFVAILDSQNTLTPEYIRSLESRLDHIKTLVSAAITRRLYPPTKYDGSIDEPLLTGADATGEKLCATGT